MTVEPRLRTMLTYEASQAEVTLSPGDIVRRARRRRRWRVTASAATAVIVGVSLVIGVPVLVPNSNGREARPAAPQEQSSTPDRGLIESGRNAEGLPLSFQVNATEWLALQRLKGKTPDAVFFAEIMPAPRYNSEPTDRLPPPEPGVGYTSLRLRDPDGDGVYTSKVRVELGRYVIAIYKSSGVRHTSDGVYPTRPVELIEPAEPVLGQAIVPVRAPTTYYAAYYRPK